MTRRFSVIAGLAAALLLATQGSATVTAPSASSPAVQDSGRRVLVLLRLPPPHIRANSDDAGSYGDGASRAARHRIAGEIAHAHGLTLVDDWPMPLLGMDCFIMLVPADRSIPETVAALSQDSAVAWVAAGQYLPHPGDSRHTQRSAVPCPARGERVASC